MNWDEVSAIGQMLGTVAVFITLVYLAVQMRHARQETRRSISAGRWAAAREMSMYRSGNERLGHVYFKAHRALDGHGLPPFVTQLAERTGLTLEEAGAINWDQFAFWNYRQQTVSQIDQLPPGERAEFDMGVRGIYGANNIIGRLWYDTSKAVLNPVTVRYVDNLLAQAA